MKYLKTILIAIVFTLFISHMGLGQDTLSLKMIGRAYPDSICLRWAPPTPVSWKLLNQYGYRLERYTIMRDSVILTEKPRVIIKDVILPMADVAWQKHIESDDNVAIAAQAIFGKDFET